MSFSTTLTCNCGQFHMEVQGAPLASVQCHCQSCRQASHDLSYLAPARPLTEDNGGTNYQVYRKDRVEFSTGVDDLHGYRLSVTAPTRRVFTKCCGTPVFVEFDHGHWLSIYSSMWRMADRIKPRLCTQTQSAPADTTFDPKIPAGHLTTAKFYARLAAAWAAMGFRTPKIYLREGTITEATNWVEPVLMQSATSQQL